MGKKLLAIFGILIGCVLLLFVSCGLILMIAPGTRIFGVRYIKGSIGSSGLIQKVNIRELTNQDEFSGNIYIDTYGVPVKVEYTTVYSSYVSFYQNFNGFTKSKERKASLETYIDEKDNLHIKTHELIPWLYEKNTKESFYLELYLAVGYQDRDVYVTSEKSSVNIVGNPTYENLEIITSNSLKIDGLVTTENFKYHTSKEIDIKEEQIKCTNADLLSSNGNINVEYALSGKLTAQTKSGNIKFVSAKELYAKSNSGDVTNFGEGKNSVFGAVNIKTTSGNVTLGNVGVESEDNSQNFVKIDSINGNVDITRLINGEISTERGKVTIGTANNLILNALTGDISVINVFNNIVVNGRNGKVVLGKDGVVNNPTVTTTTGNISVFNTTGIVDLSSSNSNIELENKSARVFNLFAGRKLSAYNLQGRVKASADGDVDMQFESTPIEFTLDVAGRGDNVDIDMTCSVYNTIDYEIRSTRGTKAEVYASGELIANGSVLGPNRIEGIAIFQITVKYAKVRLYLTA